ncbi:MAG TPA: adenosylcobinamide-phosphate synthase CbiB [Pyrinomonadaceae bacterium]|nr:adenosylcobinamide-phosphate synthase CbiB [Pyrinomonadaceae bacterium]
MRTRTLIAGCALDFLAGDPLWLPHPVRVIGAAIGAGEKLTRKFTSSASPRSELLAGAALSLAVIFGSYKGANFLLKVTRKFDLTSGDAVEIILAWTTIAARNLLDETGSVLDALENGEIEIARRRLARIVGRDTVNLDESEIARATIETAAESLCDGIVAPLFYLALGGVPLAFAYKAANTLDSMIGHREAPYTHFGRFAARVDDAANFVPARLSALFIIASAKLLKADAKSALRVWRRDARLHSSPNAGQTEAAMAGALNTKLGGLNFYDGQPHQSAEFGAEYEPPIKSDVSRARQIVLTASILAGAAAAAFCWFGNRKSQRLRLEAISKI